MADASTPFVRVGSRLMAGGGTHAMKLGSCREPKRDMSAGDARIPGEHCLNDARSEEHDGRQRRRRTTGQGCQLRIVNETSRCALATWRVVTFSDLGAFFFLW